MGQRVRMKWLRLSQLCMKKGFCGLYNLYHLRSKNTSTYKYWRAREMAKWNGF